jgi:hypothetical protein
MSTFLPDAAARARPQPRTGISWGALATVLLFSLACENNMDPAVLAIERGPEYWEAVEGFRTTRGISDSEAMRLADKDLNAGLTGIARWSKGVARPWFAKSGVSPNGAEELMITKVRNAVAAGEFGSWSTHDVRNHLQICIEGHSTTGEAKNAVDYCWCEAHQLARMFANVRALSRWKIQGGNVRLLYTSSPALMSCYERFY